MEDKGVEELRQRIVEDAGKEAAELIRKAEERVAARLAQARAEAEGSRADILRRAQEDAALVAKRTLSKVQLEARRIEMQGRETLIGEVMKRVEARVQAMRSDHGYPDLIARLIVDGAQDIGDTELEVAVSAPDKALFNDAFVRRVTGELEKAGLAGASLTLAAEEIQGTGAIVRSRSGRVEVNNTLEASMRRESRELRLIISKTLFGEA